MGSLWNHLWRRPATNASANHAPEAETPVRAANARSPDPAARSFDPFVAAVADYAIFLLDPQGVVTSWNCGARAILGYRAEEIIGQHFSGFYPREAVRAGLPESELEAAKAAGRYADEGWRVRRDGTTFWADVAFTAAFDPAGQLLGFVQIARDMSERKLAEDRLIQAQAELGAQVRQKTAEAARADETLQIEIVERKRLERELVKRIQELTDTDRRKSEFLATLAHELRNPLAPIRNALQLMRMAGDDPAIMTEVRAIVERQSSQLVRLIDDLLDLSRLSRNKVALRKEWVDLQTIISSAVETSRPLIDAQRQELTIALPDSPIPIEADLTRLAQVFSSLLNNAARFTQVGGHIRIVAEHDDREIVVRVTDDGIGIVAQVLPHIFEMFVQGDASLERSRGGLGIGLTLVKQLVEMHDGSTVARSEGPGRGSEFTVRLPFQGGPAARGPAPVPEETAMASVPHRVLVADDNEDSAKSLSIMLSMMSNEVRTAYNGVQAVDAAESFHPDLAILDIGMPKLNGCDAARRMRERDWAHHLVLVALTGWGQDEDRRRTREAGFDYHLVKPLSAAALKKLLASLAPR